MMYRIVQCACVGAIALLVAATGPIAAQSAQTTRGAAAGIHFTDISASAGLQFRHVSGKSGRFYFIEQWGSGAAFFDYDGDGWLDLFLAQGGALPGFEGATPVGNRLFRNNRNGTFTDVTEAAGLVSDRYTLGVATADYDNDGYADLFITTLQGNVLYHNDGHGRFIDVTASAGVAGQALSTSAAFLDYDGDGRLDLFVARYRDYNLATDQGCEIPDFGMRPPGAPPRISFCGPFSDGVSNRLYRNQGDGTFRDVTASSGIGKGIGRGLGVAVADFNEDGFPDVFVASDNLPNLLFINNGTGTFTEQALRAGVAVGSEGRAYAGMGVDAADYDNDGHIDLVVTNYENEPTSLYRNLGDGTFEDRSARSGLNALVWGFMKWGVRLVDLNGDGLKDLFSVNGHIYEDVAIVTPPGLPLPGTTRKRYAQQAQVLVQQTPGRFADHSAAAGPFFKETHVSRGAAFADFDNDGDWDALVTNLNGPAVLLRNDAPAGRWARLALEGRGCNRDAIGARVRVTVGALTQTAIVQSGGSYLSDHDRRPLFGLPDDGPATAEIRWPCGAVQTVNLSPGVTQRVQETGCLLRNAGRAGR